MKRLYILCEGQTEEDFVSIILNPYLQGVGIYAFPKVCYTKKTSIKTYKGGATSYGKIKNELKILCGEHPNEMVTTMFDLYALPNDTPGIGNSIINIYDKVEYIENSIMDDVGSRFRNLFVNLMLHEFEGLLFTDTSAFESIADDEAIYELQAIKSSFPTPEHINDSPETAPSKRIEKIIPGYAKVIDGIDIAEKIGIGKISSECRHFEKWITKLVDWAKEGTQ